MPPAIEETITPKLLQRQSPGLIEERRREAGSLPNVEVVRGRNRGRRSWRKARKRDHPIRRKHEWAAPTSQMM